MYRAVVIRGILLSLISIWATQSAADSIGLFRIQSQAFPLPVIYTANTNANCTFSKKPIAVAWYGDTSKLSIKDLLFLNKVMGASISNKTPQSLVFQVNVMAKYKVLWPLNVQLASVNGKCAAIAVTTDKGEIIQSIDVLSLKGTLPTQVQVDGIFNGQTVQRQISF